MRHATPLVFVLAVLVGLAAEIHPKTAEAAPRRVRITAEPGGSLLVHGEYPRSTSSCVNATQPLLHARFRGAVEIGRAPEGIFLIGELPFQDYLKGIAEVPRDWPMEALKAQVVAARTYAMSRLRLGSSEGEALGYDLCATTACQVYIGMGVEGGPWGGRWRRAVDETDGEVLLHQGRPADALYSSTSPGRTYGNEVVFGGAPAPYLRPIKEHDDGESPLANWTVTFPYDDLARFLRASGYWTAGSVSSVVQRGGMVVIRGGGQRLRVEKEELRDALNSVASCLDPDYPSREPDGYRLPQTVPSKWYRAHSDGPALILRGRGWGHGVGMVQWGAKGKADRGLTYDEILAAYYGGLRPTSVRTPTTIRVLVADGLRRVTVVPSGISELSGRMGAPPGPWMIRGERLRVRTAEPPPPVLRLRAEAPVPTGGGIALPVRLSRDARVRVDGVSGGETVTTTGWVPLREGRRRIPLELGGDIESLLVTADDGIDRVTATAPGVEGGPEPTAPSAAPPTTDAAPVRADRGVSPAWFAVPVLGLLAALAAWLTTRRRKGLHRR